jgi:two-component system chemotaxis response regulator CheY
MTRRVLVVDDSPSIRRMVAATLQGAGYEVTECGDGQEALDRVRLRPAHAVLTDQNMPRLDGLGFIRAFRARPESQGVPVIFLSTKARGRSRTRPAPRAPSAG